jgi:hypothetical protein
MQNIKHEALYMTLSGYAKEIVDMKDTSLDGIPLKIALVMNKNFNKNSKLYNVKTANLIVEELKIWDEHFKEASTAPSILLILTLDYLLNICEHYKTKLHYGHLRSDLTRLFNAIELSEYKEHLYEHLELMDKFMEVKK